MSVANYGNMPFSEVIKNFAETARNKVLLAKQKADVARNNPIYGSPFMAGQRDKEVAKHTAEAEAWEQLATTADSGYMLFDPVHPIFSCKHDGLVNRAAKEGRLRYLADESGRQAARNNMPTEPGLTQRVYGYTEK